MCRPQFHARFCVCPERSFCVPCLWRPARNVWPCRACVRPDPLAMSLPAAPPVVRQKPGQRRWSDVRWPCRAVLPVFAVVSRWGQAGEKFQANHRPPGSAAGTRHMEKLRLRLGTSLGDKWTRLVTSLQFWIF